MDRGRFDWLADLTGAAALGVAGGYSALKAAPALGMHGVQALSLAGLGLFAVGLLGMRNVPAVGRHHPLPEFDLAKLADVVPPRDQVAEEPLLLDSPAEKDVLVLDSPLTDDVLLLKDALVRPSEGCRVIRLSGAESLPTAGELKERIDRHLDRSARAVASPPAALADPSAALAAAIDELRRSLR